MPKKVYNNVVDHKLIWDTLFVVEDVTSVQLPTVEHPTTSFDVSGMSGAVDVPNQYKTNAMNLTISHNGGVNCDKLITPDVHTIELRIARQMFDTTEIDVAPVGSKYIFKVMHVSTTDGTIESGNPRGSTETYSVLSMQKIDNGETVINVNIPQGKNEYCGVDYSDPYRSLLD